MIMGEGVIEEGAVDCPNDPNILLQCCSPPSDNKSELGQGINSKEETVVAVKAASIAWQMKGLKHKRKYTRNNRAPSSTNQKDTNFNYEAFWQVSATLPRTWVDALIAPGKARSPLLKVKRVRIILRASLEASARKRHTLVAKSHCDDEKIAKLKLINNQLMADIRWERRASKKIIDEAMVEARCLSAEALHMMSKANEMYYDVEERIITERNRASAWLREERTHHSRESDWLWQKQAASIEKLHQEQASLINELESKSSKKYHKVRDDLAMVSNKLKEQHLIWQKRLSNMDSSYKNLLSKERARRRNVVQQQLDWTSAIKGQLMEIIKGLEVMNSELVDEAKSAKKAKREAIRLYNKSKEAATRRLNQLWERSEESSKGWSHLCTKIATSSGNSTHWV